MFNEENKTNNKSKKNPQPHNQSLLKKFLQVFRSRVFFTFDILTWGYDQFMNIVLDNAVEIVSPTEKVDIGMVVIRGNSIQMWECLDKVRQM